MIVQLNDKIEANIRRLESTDFVKLYRYCSTLTELTKKRFAPHSFDLISIQVICNNLKQSNAKYYVAESLVTGEIISYCIIHSGLSLNDNNRIKSGFDYTQNTCSFAPSVADHCQGKGLGQLMFNFIRSELKALAISRIVLQGGVQQNNLAAIKYYAKLGFTIESEFDRDGIMNYAMSMFI